jgi:hypothetical protein
MSEVNNLLPLTNSILKQKASSFVLSQSPEVYL